MVESLKVQYVLVGAGTASFFALRGILEVDPHAKVLIIGDEAEAPYMRTPLTKELWFQDGSQAPEGGTGGGLSFVDWAGHERSLFYEADSFFCAADELAAAAGNPLPAPATIRPSLGTIGTSAGECSHSVG